MKTIIFTYLIMYCVSATAQIIYREGHIIDNNHKIHGGLIGSWNWGTIPTTIYFKDSDINRSTEKFTANDLLTVDIRGEERYVSGVIAGKRQFLILLVQGSKVNIALLPSEKDNWASWTGGRSIPDYYISPGNQPDSFYQLNFKGLVMDNEGRLVYARGYINQLLAYIDTSRAEGKAAAQIVKTGYLDYTNLIWMGTMINRPSCGYQMDFTVPLPLQRSRYYNYFFGGGVMQHQFSFLLDTDLGTMRITRASGSFVQAGFQTFNAFHLPNLTSRAFVGFNTINYRGAGEYYADTSLSLSLFQRQVNLMLAVGEKYEFMHFKRLLSLFAGIDGIINGTKLLEKALTTKPRDALNADELSDRILPVGIFVQFNLRAGIVLRDRIELDIHRGYCTTWGTFGGTNMRPSVFGLSLVYHLKKRSYDENADHANKMNKLYKKAGSCHCQVTDNDDSPNEY